MRPASTRPALPALLAAFVTFFAVIPATLVHSESWSRIGNRGPNARWPVVSDDVGGRIFFIESAVLWSLSPGSGTSWTSIELGGMPPTASLLGAGGAFDAQGNRVLLLVNDQVWEIRLSAPAGWHLLSTSGVGPSPRVFGTVVVDPVGPRLIVFGGGTGGAQYNDLYQLSLGATPTWTRLIDNDVPGSPDRRERHSTIVDLGRRRIVVFGGVGPSGLLNDVWALPLDGPPVWLSIPTVGPPSPRNQHAAAYDALNDRMVIFGGYDGSYPSDAHALPFTGPAQWASLPSHLGFARATAVYDPAGQRILIPNGRQTEALAVAGTPQWSVFERHIEPFARGAGVVGQGKFVVHPGRGEGDVPGTWMLDLSLPNASWVRFDGGPLGRMEMAMVWDPLRARALTYGGFNISGTEFNDIWSLSLGPPPVWTLGQTPGALPGYGWRGIYDPSGDRLAFLALDVIQPPCCTYTNTIMVLPLSGPQTGLWSQHELPPSFLRREHASFTYDATRDVAWVYGGAPIGHPLLGDIWQMSLTGTPTMTPIAATGTLPTPRSNHAAVFDDLRDRLVVFGGDTGNSLQNDVWQFEPGAGNRWSPIIPTGGPPPAREDMAYAFDSATHRLVIFGGSGGLDDTWALDLNDSPTAIGLAPVSVDATPDRVRIVWMGGEPGMSVRIDRRSGGEWASLGTRSADGVGRIVLEDRDVAAGMWLEYRLAVVQDGVETYFGTANAAVPSWALDVSGVPLSGGITLRIQLPSGEPATVALFDLAGRRVWSREIGHLGAGLHEVRAEGAAVKSGVYFVRLTQAAVARSARVAVFE